MSDFLWECESWDSFRSSISPLSEKQKGNCFEALTKFYLQLHPTYATQLKSVWHLSEVPLKVRTYLNLPNSDEGIDLIAETKEGEFWAIQSKYRENESVSITHNDLATFFSLAFTICRHIAFGLICTNADRFSYKLRFYGDRIGFCAGDIWRSLDSEFFHRLHDFLAGKSTPPEALKPFPHQKSAIESAFKHFVEDGNSRGKMIMPCGTGKSLAAYWIAERLDARTILIAVPSLALIRQTFEVWARESVANERIIDWIAVCSDQSVGDIERDDIAIRTQDLGVRVHTDPEEVANWLRGHKDQITVVFSTYQSGRAVAEATRRAELVFDIAVLDEAHKTVGRKGNLFSHLLYEENVSIRKRLFMTATERRYIGSSDEIASMENPNLYGDTFELLSFKKALDADPPILCDYKILTLVITKREIRELIDQNLLVRPDKGEWDKEVETEMLAALVALRKAVQNHPIKHAVSFHNSIARASAFRTSQDIFTKAFPSYGELESFHVSGGMPTVKRSRILEAFVNATRSLITNARCLTEGVDVKGIDCILFADPRRSKVDIVQAVGRALRRAEGKEMGYVIVPVVIESEATESEMVRDEPYGAILTVLRALAANDERIIEYFRTVSQGRRWTGGNVLFEIDIPQGLPIDAESFISSIEYKCWSRLARLSWRPFEEARTFVRSLGLKGQKEWYDYCGGRLTEKGKLPEDIPSNPNLVYKDGGWLSYGDWLGTGTVADRLRKYREFDEARAFVRSLGLKSRKEWFDYCRGRLPEKGKLPEDISQSPHQTYKNKGWVSVGDWLGTGTVAPQLRKYRKFDEARAFVRSLGLKGNKEWNDYCGGRLPEKGKLQEDIPSNPNLVYKDGGWLSYGDWLGTGTVAARLRKYREFNEARAFVRGLRLKSSQEWRDYCRGRRPEKGKLPEDIPATPNHVYKGEGWVSMGDWLGTGTVAHQLRKYREFNEARAFVRGLGFTGHKEWNDYCRGRLSEKGRLPEDIPAMPNQIYKGQGWVSLGDWLGTGTVATRLRRYREFNEARAFVRGLGFTGHKEWNDYCGGRLPEKGRLPEDIPASPNRVYKGQGWVSLGDWLGTGASSRRYRVK
jgi:superfamily II DNA or RNA helicase